MPVENVKLTVEASNPRLRIDSQPSVLRIGPHSRATVSVSVTALAAGLVPLRTTLTTPDGTVVGQGADVQVRVTPTGNWVYWGLGGIAGAILLLGIVRTRFVVARATTGPTPPPPAAGEATAHDRRATASSPSAASPGPAPLMAAGTVVSRLLGLRRTALLLGLAVGIGLSADTFQVANTLPNQFYLLLAGGVLNAVLVPQITKAATYDDGGHDFVNRLLTLSLALLLGATLVVTAAAPLLVRLFSQGWDSPTIGLATAFALICLPQVFFYGLYTLLGQVLNARGQFAAYMWAPALANIVAIGGLVVVPLAYAPHQPSVAAVDRVDDLGAGRHGHPRCGRAGGGPVAAAAPRAASATARSGGSAASDCAPPPGSPCWTFAAVGVSQPASSSPRR